MKSLLKISRANTRIVNTLIRISRRCKSDDDKKKKVCISPQADKNPAVYDCGVDLDDRGIYNVEPCDALKTLKQPAVVVVGAGMAGISAAARLAQRGITNVTVLEASERPGGRIKSAWLGDVVAELGAGWRPPNTYTHPVFSLAARELPPRPGVPGSEHTRGLFTNVIFGKMPYPPTINAYHKFRQIEKEASSIYCFGSYKQHGSLMNFMSLRIQQELHEFPEDQQHDAARVMFGLAHMVTARSAYDTSLLCADQLGCFMNIPGSEVRVPLGQIGMIAPMMCQIPEGAIQFCRPVTSIYWGTSQRSGFRAIVVTTDSMEYKCDYVIVTVSLGVLYHCSTTMFCPTLPASKLQAMSCIGFGALNKIFLEYCRPFWYWQQTNLNFRFCPGQLCNRSDWTRGITAIEIVPNSKCVLCVFVQGPEAMCMEGLCDKDIAEGVTDLLRTSTCNMNIPYPMAILRSCWCSDPLYCGAYSYEPCNTNGCAQEALACPLPGPTEPVPPILLFAGEATIPGHYSTLAGARLSGIREAERIVQMTIQYKGPPVPIDETNRRSEQKPCYTAAGKK